MDSLQNFVWIFALTIPAYLLPLVVSAVLYAFFRNYPFRSVSIWFILKPLIATPLWIFLYLVMLSINYLYHTTAFYAATILPGLVITLLLVLAFRQVLMSDLAFLSLLVGMDLVRWLYTFFLFLPWINSSPVEMIRTPWFSIALVLPSLYAGIVLAMVRSRYLRDTHENLE